MKDSADQETRVWLSQYEEGVPADIETDLYTSAVDILENCFDKYSALPAYECNGVIISYKKLDQLTCIFASYLQNDLGLIKGDRVALMLPNLIQHPVAAFGALRAGMVVVNVNPCYTPREMEFQLKGCSPRAIIVIDEAFDKLEKVLANVPIEFVVTTGSDDISKAVSGETKPIETITGTNSFLNIMYCGKELLFKHVILTQDDIAFLQYTGGTTGLPKGVIITHGNLVATLAQNAAWFGKHLKKGEEIFFTALPLYHIYALIINSLLCVFFGGHNVLIPNPKDISGFINELSEKRFTVLFGVATLYRSLLNAENFYKLNFSTLKLSACGGMPTPKALLEKWQEMAGMPLIEGYGLTESTTTVCSTPLDKNSTMGLVPVSSTYVSLRGDDGEEVPAGQPGEIYVKGPQVAHGYWNNPKETEALFTKDGYLRTGDMAVMNRNGCIKIVGRKKDMIIVSGFNVYPIEIESVALMHPGICEAACIGVEDDRCGAVIKLFVVRKNPNVTAEELMDHCRQNLTRYKVPKLVEFRESLPKSNVGKILRSQLV